MELEQTGTTSNRMQFEINEQNADEGKRNVNSKKSSTIIFALLSIVILLSIVSLYSYQKMHPDLPKTEAQYATPKILTMNNVLDGSYEPRRFNGTWVSDEEIMMVNQEGQVVLYNVRNLTQRSIVKDLSLVEDISSLDLSPDHKFLLVSHNVQKVFRHSVFAQYSIINLETQEKSVLVNSDGNPLIIQLAKWSSVGNGFAYVYLNDVYYRPSAENGFQYRLTFTGYPSIVYNGINDWVYEEEVFSETSAMWFSDDGSKLAFASFNDSNVDVMLIPYYGEPGALASQYPQMISIRYPKPGRPNPGVAVSVIDLQALDKNTSITLLPPPPPLGDAILSAVSWVDDSELSAVWMNRAQNHALLVACNVTGRSCRTIRSLESKEGWLDMFSAPLFSADGRKLIFPYSQDQGSLAGNFTQITLIDRDTGVMRALTSGKSTVTEILGWDESSHSIYYLSTEEGHPEYQRVYKVSDSLEGAPHKGSCISCSLSNDSEETCNYAGASFSKAYSYHTFTCSGPQIPTVVIRNKAGQKIINWESNDKIRRNIAGLQLPSITYMKVNIANGLKADVKLLLPPDFDESGQTKYSLLVNVYAGPGSYQVVDRFGISWNAYFSAHKKVVVAFIDGRGSGLKGDRMLYAGYRKLGTVEIEDQINVTRKLIKLLPYLDENRTAIWGWSYGGYVTGMVLASDPTNTFKCGVSVAPVTDWIYYDTIYTERYMGLPTLKDNLHGYVAASLINKARKLAGKKYLLIHGTLDDNVHYQQSMMLSRTLEKYDIMFSQQSYPDEDHGLQGVKHHFYHTIESFLSECLQL